MPKPACVKCQRFYRPKKNGVWVCESMPIAGLPMPGTLEPSGWEPYKIWVADLWQCEGCGQELVTGWSHDRLAEHYEPRFAELLGGVTITINDC